MKNASGEIEKILVVIEDRTEQIKLAEALAEREKEQSAKIEKLYQILNLDPGVFKSFLEEAQRTVQLVLEKLPQAVQDRGALDLCFREVHTLKGNARALNLDAIAKHSHELEDVLDLMRQGNEGDPARARALTENLSAEVQDGGSLFEKILNMKDVFRVQTLDAAAGLGERAERIVEQEALGSGKAVAFTFDNHAGAIRGDALVKLRAIAGHLVRNAVIHGIETPENRREKGKPMDGRIKLSLDRADGHVRLSVEDDGQGLDQDRIARRAVEMGMYTPETAEQAQPAEILRLIFRPGFSTAEVVTESAGRGVGLDVVEEEAKAMGGSVRVETKRGAFSRFSVLLPETILERRD